MTAFRILSIGCILGLFAFLSYRRFKASSLLQNQPFFSKLTAYFRWLGFYIPTVFSHAGWRKIWSFYLAWLNSYPQAWQKWALGGFLLSFLYLAASGFAFALFTSRGLFGLPLLFHVFGGGIFSLCLALLVILRAKHYSRLTPQNGMAEASSGSLHLNRLTSLLRPALFWLFVLSGFSLGLTALLSMFPYFSFEGQAGLVTVHRYSALIGFLSAMLFLDQAIARSKSR